MSFVRNSLFCKLLVGALCVTALTALSATITPDHAGNLAAQAPTPSTDVAIATPAR